MNRTGQLLIASLLTMPLWCVAQAREPVMLLYNDRPPYAVSQADGSVTGLTATPAARAFQAAGIPVRWLNTPTNRQLSLIVDAPGMYCALGWFRNPRRESYAKFSKPLYRDQPTVALANPRFPAMDGTPLAAVLSMGNVRVLVKHHFSYGPHVDRLLLQLHPAIVKTTNENAGMVQMIQADRADFMFVAAEEAAYFIQQSRRDRQELRLLRFADMPPGEKRHLMCSKSVPDEVIDRVNRAIPAE